MSVTLPPRHPFRDEGRQQQPLRQFGVALARAKGGTGACNLMWLADSIGEGALNASPNLRFLDLVRDQLRDTWQPAGVAGGYGYVPARINISGYANPFVNAGGTASSLVGLGLRAVRLTGAGQTLTLTMTATRFGLRYYQAGTGVPGSFKWSIDGGATTTVNSGVSPAEISKVLNLDTGSSASHTLLIEWVSGTVYVEGAMVYDGDEAAGIRVWDASSGGATTQTFQDTAFNSSAQNWLAGMAGIPPDAVFIALGGNDYSYLRAADSRGQTPAQVAANYLTIAGLIRTTATTYGIKTPSIVFVVGYNWPAFTTGGAFATQWSDFDHAITGAAIQDGAVGLLNLNRRFGDRADLLGLIADTVHLTALGSGFYANPVVGYLEP